MRLSPADARDAIEHPGKFGMLGNLALVEHDMCFWIDPQAMKAAVTSLMLAFNSSGFCGS